jgi:hypothetical protein
MKCPKCGYTSFAYLENCRQCGQGLAEQQAAFGFYALRPSPPDLLMAYQAAAMDVDDTTLAAPALPSPAIDLSQLVEIELDIAATEELPPVADMEARQAGDAVDLAPTTLLDSTAELEPLEVEPHTEQMNPSAGDTPRTVELSEARDITFELEPAADLGAGGTGLHSGQTPEENPVYDLDLEEEREGLTLGPEVRESRADEDTAEDERVEGTAEYILEIEDELELEIDEIELEDNDDESGERDNDR